MDDLLNRHDLSDEEWERLAPLMPPTRGRGTAERPPDGDQRDLVPGRAGCPWRDLPGEFGNWSSVYGRHRRWSLDGTWAQILDRLRAGCDQAEGRDWTVSADPPWYARISTRPAPAGRCPPNWSGGAGPNDNNRLAGGPGREALGRSRGGLTTKIDLVADRRCRPVTPILTPGQHGDCPQFIPLMGQVRMLRRGPGRPRTRPGRAMGDKAYSSAANRNYLRRRGIQAVIPVKDDQQGHRRARGRRGGRPPAFDPQRYKERNTVERCFPSSSSSAPSPPAMTSGNSSTRAPWTLPQSGSGYATHHMIYTTRPRREAGCLPTSGSGSGRSGSGSGRSGSGRPRRCPRRPVRQEGVMLRRFLVAVFGVVLALSGASAASASYPGKNGLIAFDRGSQIHTMSPSGTGLKKLTSSGKNYAPVWNPAGTKIAYLHVAASGVSDIWVMAANGSNKRQWTNTGEVDCAPAWSPNGKTFVLSDVESWQDNECGCTATSPLLVTTSATTPFQPLHVLFGYNQDNSDEYTRLVGYNPSWIEGRIAFHSDPMTTALTVTRASVRQKDRRTWARTASRSMFAATQAVSMPPGAGEATQCGSAGGASAYGYVNWPHWAPDGSNLLYSYQMWPANGDVLPLPWQVAKAYGGTLSSQPGDEQADYSPNGSFIVLTNVLPGQMSGTIVIESKTGTNRRDLAQGYQPNWQPVP